MTERLLSPGRILFTEVAGTPIEGESVNQYPAQEIEYPANLFTGLDLRNIEIARLQ